MNTKEDNQNNNNNEFEPTKELGDFTKFAARYAFGVINTSAKIEKVARLDDSTIDARWNMDDKKRLYSFTGTRH